jgi:hypothetical protein
MIDIEDEDEDPVGCPPVRDPLLEFRKIAENHGLIREGDPIDNNLVQAFYAVVERCACVAEPFAPGDDAPNAADAIRAKLGQE